MSQPQSPQSNISRINFSPSNEMKFTHNLNFYSDAQEDNKQEFPSIPGKTASKKKLNKRRASLQQQQFQQLFPNQKIRQKTKKQILLSPLVIETYIQNLRLTQRKGSKGFQTSRSGLKADNKPFMAFDTKRTQSKSGKKKMQKSSYKINENFQHFAVDALIKNQSKDGYKVSAKKLKKVKSLSNDQKILDWWNSSSAINEK